MSIAQGIKSIAEDIEVSHDVRVAFVSDLFKETDETLKRFNREHHNMAVNIRDLLSSDRETREKTVRALRSENIKELTKMAEQLSNFLNDSRATLKKDTATLMTQIKNELAALEKELSNFLSEFNKNHAAMALNMRTELSSATKQRIEEVQKTLANFASEHQALSDQLREDLSAFHSQLAKSVKEMRAPVISDLQEAKQNWQTLTKTMAAKRGKKITPTPKRLKVPEKESARLVKPSGTNLKGKVLELVTRHPQGITLPKMGEALNIPYIQLAMPAKELIAQGKIDKRNSNYYPM